MLTLTKLNVVKGANLKETISWLAASGVSIKTGYHEFATAYSWHLFSLYF